MNIKIYIISFLLFSILLPSKQYKNFINSSLFEFEKATKVFDEILNRDYNLLSYENQVWDGVSNQWNNNNKQSYEYDQSNNQIEFLYQLWNNEIWVDYLKTTPEYGKQAVGLESVKELTTDVVEVAEGTKTKQTTAA